MASLIVFIILVIFVMLVTGREFSNTHDTEIYRLLKKLNKPFLKSIKSPDGDIIDCVHIKNHPIYDHPLFKNHTIQMRPSSYPKGWNIKSSYIKKQNMVNQLWTTNGKCPKNCIPIRRTRKSDILRAESIEGYGKKNSYNIRQPKPTNSTRANRKHEYAILDMITSDSPGGKFHGTKANINVWKPYVQKRREFSVAQVWVSAGSYETQLNSIEAGWQVCKKLYGDSNPRYFIYWTVDGYKKTGCYNLRCEGFISTNRGFVLGAVIRRVSTIDGPQIEISTSIWKDPDTGDWWLAFNTHVVGYWPSLLFNTLKNGATNIQWGGEIYNIQEHSQHTSTQMGSGLFAEEGKQRASYFRNLEIIDESDTTKQPVDPFSYASDPSCYNIISGTNPHSGVFFYYGGPGQNSNCN